MSKLRAVIRKKDANQPEMEKTLQEHDYLTESTHTLGGGKLDLIVAGRHYGHKMNMIVWVEVKNLGGSMTEDENKFHKKWQGMPIIIAFHARDVLRWFGHPEWDHV